MTSMTDLVEAWARVQDFFDGDVEKTTLWFSTGNPMLGGISPDLMMELGRSKRLLEWIKQQLAENLLPGHDSQEGRKP